MNKELTVVEAQELRYQANNEILAIVKRFEKATNMSVIDVKMIREDADEIGRRFTSDCQIVVRL